jgi:hypothetical protein
MPRSPIGPEVIMNAPASATRSRITGSRPASLTGLVLALALSAAIAPTAWAAGGNAPASGSSSSSTANRLPASTLTDVSTPITRADAALARAIRALRANRLGRAITALGNLRTNVVAANRAARDLIGEPPADPESDDLPGPPAVFAAIALDHRVVSGVVPLFNGRKRADLIDALGLVLRSAQRQRIITLDAVIALPAEGDGADYADGMADRLGQFSQEVTQLKTAVSSYTLTTAAHQYLADSLARAKRTNAKVVAAWGGGE